MAMLSTLVAGAFDTGLYAPQSVLASGRWVKVSVPESGLYRIPASTLRQWGFSDASRVRIHGYGGRRISDILTESEYVDDLPAIQSQTCSDGSIVFYAVGPEEWEQSRGFFRRMSNPYSDEGFYFISESDDEPMAMAATGTPGASNPATTFTERLQHEQDLVSPGEGGAMLVGEDFRYTPKRSFTFDLPGIVGQLKFETSFVAKTFNSSSKLSFEANGEALSSESSDVIPASSSTIENYGTEAKSQHTISVSGERLELTISHSASTLVYGAWLNYIAINYERALELPSTGTLQFGSDVTRMSLSGAGADRNSIHIWDVTDAADIKLVDFAVEGQNAVWTSQYSGHREYAAWRDGAQLPAPRFETVVSNQNLHADEPVDMVIFTHPAWQSQAERIAELHRAEPDNMKVKVVDVAEVYNEFSSGVPDIAGLRKYLKMLYDRGKAAGSPLRYALLMGRATYDERHLTDGVKALGWPTLPTWQLRDLSLSLNPEEGYETDDVLAMLDDGSGSDMGLDKLSVAVGRLPVTSTSNAKVMVDKIIEYARKSRRSQWKNRIVALADDGDANVHMTQTENFVAGVTGNENNPFIIEKVYTSAYELSGGVYQQARDKMFMSLQDGAVWWSFVGHANNHSWTGEGMLTYTDINSMYLRNLPFLYASTCNFLKWDSNIISGGEILMSERYGGVIGMISALRPVYISYNGYFTRAIGKALSLRDDDGCLLTTGEMYRQAKNNLLDDNGNLSSNKNRLRYVFMGDPALRLATPSNLVEIESVAGIGIDSGEQIIIPARGTPVIKGVVRSADGAVMDDFDGTLFMDIYDADFSTTTNDTDASTQKTFEEHGDKLYSGSCKVVGGRFELLVSMPAEISDNFREATISMYAYEDDSDIDAVGLDRNCYVFGYDEDVADDTEPPVIESLVLNHPSFNDGDVVNADPMLIATVSDNVGINLSSAGVGHRMTITLDEKTSFNDVPFYYTPSSDGDPSGEIAYPLEGLTEGHHVLSLRIFDTNGNSASKSIECFVRDGIAPTIFDVYTDTSPATSEANFYISHNRPDAMLTVTVTVYNLLGHELWSETSTGRSDMFVSSPVTWDLCDRTGSRVRRGIYVYRAVVTADGEAFETASRKIAVTAR